jgi:hypothetical protein
MLRKIILFYGDPGIGLPWAGKQGTALLWLRLRHRGFGIWFERDKYVRPRLCVGLFWVYRFEILHHCTLIEDSKFSNLWR